MSLNSPIGYLSKAEAGVIIGQLNFIYYYLEKWGYKKTIQFLKEMDDEVPINTMSKYLISKKHKGIAGDELNILKEKLTKTLYKESFKVNLEKSYFVTKILCIENPGIIQDAICKTIVRYMFENKIDLAIKQSKNNKFICNWFAAYFIENLYTELNSEDSKELILNPILNENVKEMLTLRNILIVLKYAHHSYKKELLKFLLINFDEAADIIINKLKDEKFKTRYNIWTNDVYNVINQTKKNTKNKVISKLLKVINDENYRDYGFSERQFNKLILVFLND